jgi:type IV secretory pathway VirB3-like protein
MTNPVFNAMNKPLLILGVPRPAFAGAFGAAVALFWFAGTLVGAALAFAALYVAARHATREDAALPAVVFAAARLARVYDSAARL